MLSHFKKFIFDVHLKKSKNKNKNEAFPFVAARSSMRYSSSDVAKLMNFNAVIKEVELQSSVTGIFLNGSSLRSQATAKVILFWL